VTCRRRGWTVVEMMVVTVLAGVVMLVISSSLTSTMRSAGQESQRAVAQGRLMVVINQFERLVLSSCVAGTSWKAASASSAAVLAFHRLSDESLAAGKPGWNAYWSCMCWDQSDGKLWLRDCPPGPPALTPPLLTRPQALGAAGLISLGGDPRSGARLLAGSVTRFEYSQESGPMARLLVELQLPGITPTAKPELFSMKRSFVFRIHN
jgi:hypothetical protein